MKFGGRGWGEHCFLTQGTFWFLANPTLLGAEWRRWRRDSTNSKQPDWGGSRMLQDRRTYSSKKNLTQTRAVNNRCCKRMILWFFFCFSVCISPSPTLSLSTEDVWFRKLTRVCALSIPDTTFPSASRLWAEWRTLERTPCTMLMEAEPVSQLWNEIQKLETWSHRKPATPKTDRS